MVAALVVGLIVFLQVVTPPPPGNTIVTPPSNTTVNNNTTNVFPAPDAEVVAATEKQAAPIILDAGMRGIDSDGGKNIGEVFNLGLQLAKIRKDLILLPVVTDLNHGMNRIVTATLSLVLAALILWGLLGKAVGSDATEAFEALMRVPLWCILALTSLQWYGMLLDMFAALAGVIASTGGAAFGPTMKPDFWSDVGLGLFALFVGVFYLINLLMFALQLFTNTAFLAFCAVVAPPFVFTKTTPWTSKWGDNWFRMVPGTCGDILAMLCILVVGAAGMDRLTGQSAFAQMALDLGLLMCLPLIRRLFGLEGNSAGSRILGAAILMRTLRNMRASGGTSAVGAAAGAAASAAASSTTAPTRAPRWENRRGTAATRKGATI